MKRHYNQFLWAAGQVSTQPLAEQLGRRHLSIRNPDAANSVWMRIQGTATPDANCFEIPARSTWEPLIPPTERIEVVTAAGVTVNLNIIEGVEDAQNS